MKKSNSLENLAKKARREIPPKVDVTGRVMAVIHAAEKEKSSPLTALSWLAAGSAALAVFLMTLAISGWTSWYHPILEIISAFSGGIL